MRWLILRSLGSLLRADPEEKHQKKPATDFRESRSLTYRMSRPARRTLRAGFRAGHEESNCSESERDAER